jgi:hypothetical protein
VWKGGFEPIGSIDEMIDGLIGTVWFEERFGVFEDDDGNAALL